MQLSLIYDLKLSIFFCQLFCNSCSFSLFHFLLQIYFPIADIAINHLYILFLHSCKANTKCYNKRRKTSVARNIVASKKISFSDLCWTTALGRVFGTGWRGPVKLDRAREVWYLLLHVLWLLLAEFNFWEGLGAGLCLHPNLNFPKILSLVFFLCGQSMIPNLAEPVILTQMPSILALSNFCTKSV